MSVYRQMTEEDLDEVVELFREMHQESVYGEDERFEYVAADMRDYVRDFLARAPRTLSLVCEDDGICGILLADCCSLRFNSKVKSVREQMLYVRKDHRGGLKGPRLMSALAKWADFKGAREVLAGTSTGIDPDRVQRLWLKLGYKTLGYTARGTL